MSNPTVIVGSPVPISSLPTATAAAVDDYAILDGATNGTRKILGSALGGLGASLEARLVSIETRLDVVEAIIQRLKDVG